MPNPKSCVLLNPEHATAEEALLWPVRFAARGVVLDSDGKMALLCVGKHRYYKLPGGGMEEGEDPKDAFMRECVEEIGCRVAIDKDLGLVEEYRKIFSLRQVSFCFLAHAQGEKRSPCFTEEEIGNGFHPIWTEPEEALRQFATCRPSNLEGRDYIVPRDTIILKKALKSLGRD
jgi:ADP-ribose pyrophosphatase YjhB (NUDIX family)